MLDLADTRWNDLEGGYRVRYDPRRALRHLESGIGAGEAWEELWQGLHHQGDVGTASYAAIPHIVRIHEARGVPDWNTYAILGVIDIARREPRNPMVPEWLTDDYEAAWRNIVPLALADLARSTDPTLVQAALAAIAIAKGLHRTGEVILDFTEDELDEIVLQYRGGGS